MIIALVISGLALAAGTWFLLRKGGAQADSTGAGADNLSPTTSSVSAPAIGTYSDKVKKFAEAIAHAEGFGLPGAIPTRYHNPGDLKPPDGSANYWMHQTGVGTGGHAIFSSDDTGWAALYRQIELWANGKSSKAGPNSSFAQLASSYAEDSQPWLANVTQYLSVTPSTRLGDYFFGG